jgi:hypothetical protein
MTSHDSVERLVIDLQRDPKAFEFRLSGAYGVSEHTANSVLLPDGADSLQRRIPVSDGMFRALLAEAGPEVRCNVRSVLLNYRQQKRFQRLWWASVPRGPGAVQGAGAPVASRPLRNLQARVERLRERRRRRRVDG